MLNTLRLRQNWRHFANDIFKCIFLNENVWISNEISLKFVPKGSINNYPALFQIMAWRRPGDKPFSEPMMVSSLTPICVTRPRWVNSFPWASIISCPNCVMNNLGLISQVIYLLALRALLWVCEYLTCCVSAWCLLGLCICIYGVETTIHPSIYIFRLGCCPFPILWGWHYV